MAEDAHRAVGALADAVIALHDLARRQADPAVGRALRILADELAALLSRIREVIG